MRSIIYLFWGCRLIGHEHSAAKKLTSLLNMSQPISKVAWKRHTKTITDAAVNVSNNSMNKAALEVKKIFSNTSYTPKHDLPEDVTEVSISVGGAWGFRGFLSWEEIVDICSEETGKAFGVILKTNYCKTCTNIKAQKGIGSINILEYVENFIKHERECLLKVQSCKLYNSKYMIASAQVTNTCGRLKLDTYLFCFSY